jgi:hypothetical protein
MTAGGSLGAALPGRAVGVAGSIPDSFGPAFKGVGDRDLVSAIALARELALELDREPGLALSCAFELEHALALARAHALGLARARCLDLSSDLDSVMELIHALDRARARNLIRALALALDLTRAAGALRARTRDLGRPAHGAIASETGTAHVALRLLALAVCILPDGDRVRYGATSSGQRPSKLKLPLRSGYR